MIWTVLPPPKEIDFQIVIRRNTSDATTNDPLWALQAKTEDWRDAFPDLTKGVEANVLDETAYL